jgi:hypothetical protein
VTLIVDIGEVDAVFLAATDAIDRCFANDELILGRG